MRYTKEDVVELVRLVDEFTKGDRSPEAELLRNTVHKNAGNILVSQFACDISALTGKGKNPE